MHWTAYGCLMVDNCHFNLNSEEVKAMINNYLWYGPLLYIVTDRKMRKQLCHFHYLIENWYDQMRISVLKLLHSQNAYIFKLTLGWQQLTVFWVWMLRRWLRMVDWDLWWFLAIAFYWWLRPNHLYQRLDCTIHRDPTLV